MKPDSLRLKLQLIETLAQEIVMSESEKFAAIENVSSFLATVGKRLRAKRRALKLTLKALSEKTDVPLSTLSKVETGQMSLNIQKLVSVCRALNIDVMQLVADEDYESESTQLITGRRSVTRADGIQYVRGQSTTYGHHASDFTKRKMRPCVLNLEVGVSPALVTHGGEEFLYVLEGEVEMVTEFYEPVLLKAGESIYLDSTMAHNVRAYGDRPAKVLNTMVAFNDGEGSYERESLDSRVPLAVKTESFSS